MSQYNFKLPIDSNLQPFVSFKLVKCSSKKINLVTTPSQCYNTDSEIKENPSAKIGTGTGGDFVSTLY